jgi:hypothetical protein
MRTSAQPCEARTRPDRHLGDRGRDGRAKYPCARERRSGPPGADVKSFLRTYADALGWTASSSRLRPSAQRRRAARSPRPVSATPGVRGPRSPRLARGDRRPVLLAGLGDRQLQPGDGGGSSTPPPASTFDVHLPASKAASSAKKRPEEAKAAGSSRAFRSSPPGRSVPEGRGVAFCAGDRPDRGAPGPYNLAFRPAGDARGALIVKRVVAQRSRRQRHRPRSPPRCAGCRRRNGRAARPRERARWHRVTGNEVLTGRVTDRNGPWL